jgi:DNA-binding CsgD family transcriptional regulator
MPPLPKPLLCIVDDTKWLDIESAEVLAFVARRLYADRIACLFGVREPADRPLPLAGIPELRIGRLVEGDARQLLGSVATASMDGRVWQRIVAETQGNPLAILELTSDLTPSELGSASLLPEPLPIGSRLQQRFLRQVRNLPADTQALLLLAAAELSGDPVVLWRAAKSLGLDRDAVAPAEAHRLLVLGPQVSFRHPLIRSAVYHGAPAADRRRMHTALATATDEGIDPDRRAWHRAAAAIDPDEEVAAELERSAERARSRGGYAATAAFVVRAANLTPDERRRAVRRLHAAQAELAAGAPTVARSLLEKATPSLADPLQLAEAKRLEAWVRFASGESRTVPGMLLEAAKALGPLNVPRARETLLEALGAASFAGRNAGEAGESAIARMAREIPRPPEVPESAADLLLDGFALLDVDYATGVPLLRRAIQALVGGAIASEQNLRFADLGVLAAAELCDLDGMQALCSRAVGLARGRGALMDLLPALAWQAVVEQLSGRLEAAETALAEGRAIAAATGNVGVFGSAGVQELPIFARRGDEAPAREVATAATRESVERGQGGMLTFIRGAVTLLELGLGNYGAALDSARPVYEEDPFYFGTAILPDFIEAAARSHDRTVALAALQRLSERALASGTELALGLLARSRALLADDKTAERQYTAAIEHLKRCQTAPQLAGAHLLYGEWLRRQGRKRDAREQLRTAHEMFSSMGVLAFAERARSELLATGEHARKRTVETQDQLTHQEAQIARLAGQGVRNQEIAAQLFISPSTVEYHLVKVFRKLGVSSRTQLAHVL